MIVADEGFDIQLRSGVAQLAGEFAVVATEADHFEAQLLAGHPRRGTACVASPKMKTRLPVR
jgi:hypothetical protein